MCEPAAGDQDVRRGLVRRDPWIPPTCQSMAEAPKSPVSPSSSASRASTARLARSSERVRKSGRKGAAGFKVRVLCLDPIAEMNHRAATAADAARYCPAFVYGALLPSAHRSRVHAQGSETFDADTHVSTKLQGQARPALQCVPSSALPFSRVRTVRASVNQLQGTEGTRSGCVFGDCADGRIGALPVCPSQLTNQLLVPYVRVRARLERLVVPPSGDSLGVIQTTGHLLSPIIPPRRQGAHSAQQRAVTAF